MALKLADYLLETANNPGTGNVNLAGAPSGRTAFSVKLSSGDTTYYYITDGVMWESGTGTFTAGTPNTLSRDTVYSNDIGTTAKRNFTGAVQVYAEVPAGKRVYIDGSGKLAIGESASNTVPLGGALNHAKGASITSASSIDLGAATGNLVHITGTTTITSLGTAPQAGARRQVVFDGALTLTHNASTLVLPGGANITTAANDSAIFEADTTTKWILRSYQRAALPVPDSGSWTPVLQGLTTAGSHTYSAQSGRWERNGKTVRISLNIALSAKDAAMSGTVVISGLPFVASATGSVFHVLSIGFARFIDLSAGYSQYGAAIGPGGATISIYQSGDNAGQDVFLPAAFASNSQIIISGSYEV